MIAFPADLATKHIVDLTPADLARCEPSFARMATDQAVFLRRHAAKERASARMCENCSCWRNGECWSTDSMETPELSEPRRYTRYNQSCEAFIARRAGDLCSDCPPVGYPTDKTRCGECPRALAEGGGE